MISVDVLLAQLPALSAPELERWISNAWVRPDGPSGAYVFRDIDVARVRLILELRTEMEVNEAALPVVLLLLDQLYDLQRRMLELHEGIRVTISDEGKRLLVARLSNGPINERHHEDLG